MPESSSQSSARGIKRRRTNESPELVTRQQGGGRSASRIDDASQRTNRPRQVIEGVNRESRRPEGARAFESASDGSDRFDSDEEQIPLRQRTGAQEGVFGMSLPGNEDEEGEEPDTEETDEEEDVVQPLPTASTSTAAPPGTARISPAVLDLTDDGDDGDEPARPSGSNSRPSPELRLKPTSSSSSSSDDLLILSTTASSHKDRKGKGRAQPTTSPSPSTQPPPSAELAPSNLPSLATLSCPICLGPPTPLALTACGHAFCAPCLHAALVAGPALTPPPPVGAGARGGGRGRGRARGARGGGARGTPPRVRGRFAARGTSGGRTEPGIGSGGPDDDADSTDEDTTGGDPELNKHCPVCRTPLYGGWGKSLRGLVIRMAPVKSRRN